MAEPVLEVHDLHVTFTTEGGPVPAVDGIDFAVAPGETLAIVGESGSGKSVSSAAVMGLLPSNAKVTGEVLLDGRELNGLPNDELRKIRGNDIAMVFQDALSALNPYYSVGWQVAEAYRLHHDVSKRKAHQRAVEMLDKVGIPDAARRAESYPHEFSGGMRQRVVIAMALVNDPRVLIADEPTTALDVTVQAQIMRLLKELQDERKMGLILITHDLGVVADVADKIAVMYAGRIVETAPVHELYKNPAHPYTRGLLDSIPRLDQKGQELFAIKGLPPNMAKPPTGCAFHPRCPKVQDICRTDYPPLHQVTDADGAALAGRSSACHFWKETIDG
jgi:oligopeptide/dipeptide ABC transporter ATP-binding protein